MHDRVHKTRAGFFCSSGLSPNASSKVLLLVSHNNFLFSKFLRYCFCLTISCSFLRKTFLSSSVSSPKNLFWSFKAVLRHLFLILVCHGRGLDARFYFTGGSEHVHCSYDYVTVFESDFTSSSISAGSTFVLLHDV